MVSLGRDLKLRGLSQIRKRATLFVAASAASALVTAALHGSPAAAQSRSVRIFAVGPKFGLDWVDTKANYRAKLLALFDRTRRTPDAPLVQAGADDVASHLPAPGGRALVVLPEDIGLMAAFAGERGRLARRSGSLVQAVVSLIAAYSPIASYYASKHPDLASRGAPTRLLALALTDTFNRVAVETFAELADRYNVWLVAGVNMARNWKIVCVSKRSFHPPPGADRCDEENPLKVALLRMPEEPEREYAYEATTPDVVNMALVFDPEGRIVAKQVKAYLTPIELRDGGLDLKPGEVDGVDVVKTGVGRLGIVTSKDAWMPDVTAKLDQRRAEILVQPEFFVGDTVKPTGMWAPDNLKASGYSDLLRHPSIEALVLPELTGNVFDFSADAQSHIAVKPRRVGGGPRGYLVGQPPAPGFAAVQPWVVPDPLRSDEPFPERRQRLGEAGLKMLPDSPVQCPDPARPGPCRGGQPEGVVWADVSLGTPRWRPVRVRRRGGSPFTTARPIALTRRPQRNITLAASGGTVFAAWEERVKGREQIFFARSRDAGRSWSRPRRPTGRRPGAASEWWPALAAGPDGRLWLAWQDDSANGIPRVYYASSTDAGRTWTRPLPASPDAPPDASQWRPSIASSESGSAALVFIDGRERSADDRLPQAHVLFTRARPTGADAPRRLDRLEPVPLAAKLDNAWAPSVAARGRRVVVTWVDFRSYDWRVYVAESTDGGDTFQLERAISDAPPEFETLADTPRVGLTEKGPLIAFTDYRKADFSARIPHPLYGVAIAEPGGPNRVIDGHGLQQISAFHPSLAALPGGPALVAWQDHARGPGEIRIARVKPGGQVARRYRVNAAGRGAWNEWRPALTIVGGRAVVAWEDARHGPAQLYVASAPLRTLR